MFSINPLRKKTNSMRRVLLPIPALLIFLTVTTTPASADHDEGQAPAPSIDPSTLHLDNSQIDPNAPDLDYVWENAYVVEGVTYPGFLRLRSRPGFVWQQGHFSNGHWVPSHWVPTHNRVDFIWERGHLGPDGYWVFGHWRNAHLPGFVWVEGRYENGVFIPGDWRPVHPRSGYVWVSGHRTPTGVWIAGHWRPRVKAGFVWVRGRFRYGRWVHGYWRPIQPRPGFIWVGGYYGPRAVWVPGFWRPLHREGYYWAPGHWRSNVWVRGGWVAGRRPHIVRHHRVYRVESIQRHRHVRPRQVYRQRQQQKEIREERRRDRREDRQQRGPRRNRH